MDATRYTDFEQLVRMLNDAKSKQSCRVALLPKFCRGTT